MTIDNATLKKMIGCETRRLTQARIADEFRRVVKELVEDPSEPLVSLSYRVDDIPERMERHREKVDGLFSSALDLAAEWLRTREHRVADLEYDHNLTRLWAARTLIECEHGAGSAKPKRIMRWLADSKCKHGYKDSSLRVMIYSAFKTITELERDREGTAYWPPFNPHH